MRKPIDSNVLVRVAKLYYIHKKTQAEIAAEMGIGRSMVSIMLGQAKERGIVEIAYNIKDPQSNVDEYSKEIERYAGIDTCLVVPFNRQNKLLAIKLINERTEAYIDDFLKDDCVIGISSGGTCFEFMRSYSPKKEVKNIVTIPLVGGSSRTSYDLQMNETVRAFSERIHGIPVYIFAPDKAVDVKEKQLYMKSSQMQRVAEVWGGLDIAVIGIGAIPGMPDLNESQINAHTYEGLMANADMPVCDICAYQLNMSGHAIENEHNGNILSASLDDLKKAPAVVAMASGVHKAFSIIAALRAGIIKTLVIDEKTAKAVLEAYRLIEPEKKNEAGKPDSAAGKIKPGQSQASALMARYNVESIDDVKEFIKALTDEAVEQALEERLKP